MESIQMFKQIKNSNKLFLTVISVSLLLLVVLSTMYFLFNNYSTNKYSIDSPKTFGITKEKYDYLINSALISPDSLKYSIDEGYAPIKVTAFQDKEIAEDFICNLWIENYIEESRGDICKIYEKNDKVELHYLDNNLLDDSTQARDVYYQFNIDADGYYYVIETKSRQKCYRDGISFIWVRYSCL